MFKLTFIVGTGFDKDGNTVFLRELSLENIRDKLVLEAGGFTEATVYGGYRHANGRNVLEESAQFTVYVLRGDPEDGHEEQHALAVNWGRNTARYMREQLNQESVVMTIESVPVEFVS